MTQMSQIQMDKNILIVSHNRASRGIENLLVILELFFQRVKAVAEITH